MSITTLQFPVRDIESLDFDTSKVMRPARYTLDVTDEILERIKECYEFGFDIETPICDPRDGKIRLYQLYIPTINLSVMWDSSNGEVLKQKGFDLLLETLVDDEKEICIHEAKFEFKWMYHTHGIQINNIIDTRILNQIDKAGLFFGYMMGGYKESNSLKHLSFEYNLGLDKEYQSYDYSSPEPLPEPVLKYGANDAKAPWYLSKIIDYPAQDIDLKVVELFCRLNVTGIPVDLTKLADIAEEYAEKAVELKETFTELTGANPASYKQVLRWMQEKWGKQSIGFHRKKKQYQPSTNQSAVNQFIAQNPDLPDIEWLRIMQQMRSIKKAADYPKQYLELARNDRVYGDYSTLAAQGEGRTSCKEPNLQNVPKPKSNTEKHNLPNIRSVFAPPEGWKFIEIDLAGCHAQILRYYSSLYYHGHSNLVEANESGVKLHFYTLVNILKDGYGIQMSPREIKKAKGDKSHPHHKLINNLYKLSKNVFYSFQNKSGASTLHDTFSTEGVEITMQTCEQFIKAATRTYPEVVNFQNRLIKEIQNSIWREKYFMPNGDFLDYCGSKIMPDGSKIYFPQKTTKLNKSLAAFWLRIEATAMKKSLLRVDRLCQSVWRGKSEIVNFSHDSMMLNTKDEFVCEVGETAMKIMIEEISKYVKDYKHEYEYRFDFKDGSEPFKGWECKTDWSTLYQGKAL